MLTCISTAQARTKCVSAFWAQSGARHLSCKFPNEVAFLMSIVKSGHEFRPRRLAQSVCLCSGARHFSCKFPCKVALQTCTHAFRLRRLAQSVCPRSGLNLRRGIFPVNFRCKVALVKCWHAFRLRRLAQSVCVWCVCVCPRYRDLAKRPVKRSCTEILPGHLFWRPCTETLHRDPVAEILTRGLLQRACQQSSYRDLVQRSHKEILPRDLL